MDIVVVLLLGLAAGVGVYAVSMRWDRPAPAVRGEGFLPEEERLQTEALQASAAEAAMRPAAGGAYVPLATGTRSTQTRLLGLLGIVVLVPIAAVTFAVAAYSVGQIVVETITRLVEKAST
ncbi:MAG: hypothetical protein M3P10_00760 [Actinomycetota bacterium]|nr:hypothetical protein [Actinomycetota bacterium]